MALKGILIDYEYCTGCHTCEVACQMENDLPPGRFGMKVNEVGPWEIEGDRWQYAYIPTPTDECNLCVERVAKGKTPNCVQHCQADVMRYGTLAELEKELEKKPKQALYAIC